MNSGKISELHQNLAYIAWQYLLDSDFGREGNGLVLEAAAIAFAGSDFTLQAEQRAVLKSLLIDLSEQLGFNLTAYCPFRRDSVASDVGVVQMVVLLAGRSAFSEKKRELARTLLGTFASEPTARLTLAQVRIDKSTGLAMSW